MKKKGDTEALITEALIFAPGLFWHVHDNLLLEYCYDYDGRVAYIKRHKPKNEIPTRLRLFKPVKGKLPPVVIEAWKVYNEACAGCNGVWAARKHRPAVYEKAWIARAKANATYKKAIADNMPAILALHTKECGCNWTPEKGICFPIQQEVKNDRPWNPGN